MKTIAKLTLVLTISLLTTSCVFDANFGFKSVQGNGNVIKEERTLNEDFSSIKVSRGMDVYLTQGDESGILIEADENLHDIIVTRVEGNTLKIYSEDNITASKAQSVYVSFINIDEVTSTSGSDVYSNGLIQAKNLRLKTSSGSDMELEIEADVVDCESSSGSFLRISGIVNQVYAQASSGSNISAGNLEANYGKGNASSGARIVLNTTEELYAKASSGGNIKYRGNPEKVTKKGGVSGYVAQQ